MNNTVEPNTALPWYHYRWPWVLMLVPFAAVLFGIFMITTALIYPDDVVVDTYYKDGQGINQLRDLDEAAVALNIKATLNLGDGREQSHIQLSGSEEPYLQLALFHVTDSKQDLSLRFNLQDGEFVSTQDSLRTLFCEPGGMVFGAARRRQRLAAAQPHSHPLDDTGVLMLDRVRTCTCYHCQDSMPAAAAYGAVIDGKERAFCCNGCVAAAQLIGALHLGNFYAYREQCAKAAPRAQRKKQTQAEDFSSAATALNDGNWELRLLIPDIRCVACVWLLEQVLAKQPGIVDVSVHFAKRRLRVVFTQATSSAMIAELVQRLGYTALADKPDLARQNLELQRRALLMRLGVAGIGMMPVMMFALASYFAGPATAQNPASGMDPVYETLLRWGALALSIPVVFYSAMPFHRGAWLALRQRSLSMDLPVSIAILAAWSLSVYNTLRFGSTVYFDTACMFAFFLLLGRYIELLSRQRFHDNEDSLLRLLPTTVTRVLGAVHTLASIDKKECVASEQIREADLLLVMAEEAIPADGIVVDGASSVSDTAFTGEPLPSLRCAGARVLAGSMNHDSALLIRASSDPQQFLIAQISRLFEQASAYRPRWSLFADRAAAWFIALVLGLSASAGAYWYSIGSPEFIVIALTVLVVACPCALSLATPVASTVATTALRKQGLLIRNGAFLERLANTSAVVFDKTGTLTEAALTLNKVQILGELSDTQAIHIATALERSSTHPIAHAFMADTDLHAEHVQVMGAGVQGQIAGTQYRLGKTEFALPSSPNLLPPNQQGLWILLASDQPLAWFQLQDTVRSDAQLLIQTLKRAGLKTAIFTGDDSLSGKTLAQSLQVDLLRTGMSPEDKIEAVRQLAQTQTVLMIGDGVNDAGAMAAASSSIAIAPRDVLVQQSADATLLAPTLGSLPAILRFAKRCRRIIRQNIAWSLLYNFTAIPFALAGMLPPWLAAIGMSLSSVLVVLNASRLRKVEN